MRTTLPPASLRILPSRGAAAGRSASCRSASGFCTWYLTIFFSILMRLMVIPPAGSKAAVIAFLERVIQVGGGVDLAVVFDFLVAPQHDHGAVLEDELVVRVLEVVLLDQHALVRLGIEAEGRAALQAFLVREEVDVLEVVVAEIGGHVGGLRDRGVDPLLRRSLDLDVLARADALRGHEILGQRLPRVLRARYRARVDELAVGQQLERV